MERGGLVDEDDEKICVIRREFGRGSDGTES